MGLEPKLYSVTILRTVLYGEIICGVDNVHYKSIYCHCMKIHTLHATLGKCPEFALLIVTSLVSVLSQKNAYKFNRHNLKLITLINNMQLFLDSTQSNLNYERSFPRIHEVLGEVWLSEHKFQTRNFDQLRIFEGIKFVNKTVQRINNFFAFLAKIETRRQKYRVLASS